MLKVIGSNIKPRADEKTYDLSTVTFSVLILTYGLSTVTYSRKLTCCKSLSSKISFHESPITLDLSQAKVQKINITVVFPQVVFDENHITFDLTQISFHERHIAFDLSQISFHENHITLDSFASQSSRKPYTSPITSIELLVAAMRERTRGVFTSAPRTLSSCMPRNVSLLCV